MWAVLGFQRLFSTMWCVGHGRYWVGLFDEKVQANTLFQDRFLQWNVSEQSHLVVVLETIACSFITVLKAWASWWLYCNGLSFGFAPVKSKDISLLQTCLKIVNLPRKELRPSWQYSAGINIHHASKDVHQMHCFAHFISKPCQSVSRVKSQPDFAVYQDGFNNTEWRHGVPNHGTAAAFLIISYAAYTKSGGHLGKVAAWTIFPFWPPLHHYPGEVRPVLWRWVL